MAITLTISHHRKVGTQSSQTTTHSQMSLLPVCEPETDSRLKLTHMLFGDDDVATRPVQGKVSTSCEVEKEDV